MSESLKSKRVLVAVVSLAGIAYQIYQLVSTGQDVPSQLILAGAAVISGLIVGDSIRPVVPKSDGTDGGKK